MLAHCLSVRIHNAECLVQSLEYQLSFLGSQTPFPTEYVQSQRVGANTEHRSSILTEELHLDLPFHFLLVRECRIRDERLEPSGEEGDST